ncbi:MAG: hypothetical protein ACLSAC_12420 [Enterocloster bolteae]
MDENILQAVKDAAIGMLRDHEPDVDVCRGNYADGQDAGAGG